MPQLIVYELPHNETLASEVRKYSENLPFDRYSESSRVSSLLGDKLSRVMPKELCQIFEKMGKTGSPDIIWLKNLPIDGVIPQDEDISDRIARKTRVTEDVMLGIANMIGYHLHSSPKEQNGAVVHNITPVRGHEQHKSSKGREPFYLHIENPFQENAPDFLMLICLHGDPTAKTTFYFIDHILQMIPEEHLEVMKQPLFEIRSGAGLDQVEQGTFPLIDSDVRNNITRLRLYQDMERINALTPEAQQTLDFLASLFQRPEISSAIHEVSLQPGEAILFNNGWGVNHSLNGVMHGRAGVISDTQRWLQRGFFHRSDTAFQAIELEDRYKATVEILRGCEPAMQRYLLNDSYNPARISEVIRSHMSKVDEENKVEDDTRVSRLLLNSVWMERNALFSPGRNMSARQEAMYLKLKQLLRERQISYREQFHRPEGRSEYAAKVRHSDLGQAAKALLLKESKRSSGNQRFVLCVLPGDRRIDTKAIKRALGFKGVSFATSRELLDQTGCMAGAVLPFVMDKSIPLLVDQQLIEQNHEIVFNAARLDASIYLTVGDYLDLADPMQIADFSCTTEAVMRMECAQ